MSMQHGMYSSGNLEKRANRISGYLFNASGGKGAGSYFQTEVRPGQWIHYVLVINADAKSREYPNGYTKIYRNGILANQDDLNYRGTPVAPSRGSAPFRIGTRDFNSFFKGAISTPFNRAPESSALLRSGTGCPSLWSERSTSKILGGVIVRLSSRLNNPCLRGGPCST